MDTIDTKVLLKIENDTGYKWVHLCYVDTKIYEEFKKFCSGDLNKSLSDWCREDFNTELQVKSSEDLQRLKDLLKEYYQKIYPELYRDSRTDRQGWIRVWVTDKMRKAVQNIGEESK